MTESAAPVRQLWYVQGSVDKAALGVTAHAYRELVMRQTQRKGDIAVAQAIATFTRMGYDVAVPLTESAPMT